MAFSCSSIPNFALSITNDNPEIADKKYGCNGKNARIIAWNYMEIRLQRQVKVWRKMFFILPLGGNIKHRFLYNFILQNLCVQVTAKHVLGECLKIWLLNGYQLTKLPRYLDSHFDQSQVWNFTATPKKFSLLFSIFFSLVFLTALVVNYKRSFSLQICASRLWNQLPLIKTRGSLNRFIPA